MTPREPDRHEAKGIETWRALRIMTEADAAPIIAAALRQAADEALKRAAYIADSYGCDYAAKNIRALASPAAAPAAEPCCAGASSGGLGHSLDCPRFPLAAPDKHEDWCALFGNPEAGKSCDCQPVASSLLRRVLAALESYADLTQSTTLDREIRALAAELRRYIATDPRDKRIAELEAALSDWRAVEAECGAVDCHCGCHVHATDLADGGEPPK